MNQLIKKVLDSIDGFLFAIFCAVVLAYYFPRLGLIEEPIGLEKIANYGVSVTFFFYGLKLNVQKLKVGLSNWKMHILIQTTTFLLFPLAIIVIHPFFESSHFQVLWIGLFFLASLPSTVSSSVVMTSIAGGNVPAAIFNASLASLIGLVLTPFWISLYVLSNSYSFDPTDIAIKLTLQVLLPVSVGMLLNKYLGNWAEANKKNLTKFDQSVILIIIYTSFCNSFSKNIFQLFSVSELVLLGIGLFVLFSIVMLFTSWISKILNFNKEDRITSMFCGSKKSLVHGTVMSKILFSGSATIGIYLLPIMLYHAIQLLATSIIARRISSEKN